MIDPKQTQFTQAEMKALLKYTRQEQCEQCTAVLDMAIVKYDADTYLNEAHDHLMHVVLNAGEKK